MHNPAKLRRSARRALRRGETIDAARLMRLASAIENPRAPPRPGHAPDEYDDTDTQTPEERRAAMEDVSKRLTERFKAFKREAVEKPELLAWRLEGLAADFTRDGWRMTCGQPFNPEDPYNSEQLAQRLENLRQDFRRHGFTIPAE